MTRRTINLLVVATLLVATIAGASAPVAADNESDPPFQVEIGNQDAGVAETVLGALSGIIDRRSPGDFITDLRDKEPTPAEQTENIRTFVNEHNQSFVNHTNTVLEHYGANVSDTTYVLELEVINEEDTGTESSSIYFIASADGANVTDLHVKNSTSKNVDSSKTMSWSKAGDLDEDIREAHEEYVQTAEIPSEGYISEMYSKYADGSSAIKVVSGD